MSELPRDLRLLTLHEYSKVASKEAAAEPMESTQQQRRLAVFSQMSALLDCTMKELADYPVDEVASAYESVTGKTTDAEDRLKLRRRLLELRNGL